MNTKFAAVIVNNKSSNTDIVYTYKFNPEEMDSIETGMRVIVPFGKGNRPVKGIVIGIKDEIDEGEYELKSILEVIDEKPLISKELIELSLWMADKYLCTNINALQAVLPPGDFKEIKTYISLNENIKGNPMLTQYERDIIEFIKSKGVRLELEELKKHINKNTLNKEIRNLEALGIIDTTLEIETSVEKKYEKIVSLVDKDISLEDIERMLRKNSPKQLEIAKYLIKVREVPLKELLNRTNSSITSVESLEKKNIVKIINRELYRTPIDSDIKCYEKHNLTDEQRNCVNAILKSIKENENSKFLIHGVTGSGKTEVYLNLVEETLKKGKDAIVLVPEISLTPQTIDRFVGRFGNNVAVLHSRLSQGERFDQWRRIREGKVKIAIGARSAVFAPFNNLGLIIIDEEHESTYKSNMNPKYDAIEVAEKRCKQNNAVLVMGSATPSIESYYKSLTGHMKLLNLTRRINNRKLPEVEIVDMREELNSGNISIFSRKLRESIEKNLSSGNQTILFLNRRGHSTFISCRSCGYVAKCDNCSISMTYHMHENRLKCHYCGKTVLPPRICPVCKSKYIKYFGIGTEKVEEYTKELFPEAAVMRMDLDTTSRKGSYESILKRMANKSIDILIGTQMIAKGLDFKGVTLVGIIAADTSLNLPDFRSSERTFQLITQVAGRAGRGEFSGHVIIQTYNPDHYSIKLAREHDYVSFYNKEILLRREFNYPPFANIITILIYGENDALVALKSNEVYNVLIEEIKKNGLVNIIENIMGPSRAPLEKIKNNYRYQIIIKCSDEQLDKLRNIIKWVCILNRQKINLDSIKISVDINPNSII
ncbi:MAG TPA: primosomal protein N' [Tissierellia bacterium]|nr:primosomal protein N' [Tissierellia bacterium]